MTEKQKRYRAWYAERKANGGCVRCSAKARPRRTLCQRCADEQSEREE